MSPSIAIFTGEMTSKPRSAVELGPRRVLDARGDRRHVVALVRDLGDDDVRVVAVGRGDDARRRPRCPASSRTSVSIPWPSVESPPVLAEPRQRLLASRRPRRPPSPRRASAAASAEPTRPQPTMIAFMSSTILASSSSRTPCGIGDDHHLAGRRAQDLVDRRAEEARLAAPARRGAHHDQVGAVSSRRLDDRLAERRGPGRPRPRRSTPCSLAELARLLDEPRARSSARRQVGVERLRHGHLEDVHHAHRAAALLGEPERGGEHLLADRRRASAGTRIRS